MKMASCKRRRIAVPSATSLTSSVSKWKWRDAEAFAKWQHARFLGIKPRPKPTLSARVFAALGDIDAQKVLKFNGHPHKFLDVRATMKRCEVGRVPHDIQLHLLRLYRYGSLSNAQYHRRSNALQEKHVAPYDLVLHNNESTLQKLVWAVHAEHAEHDILSPETDAPHSDREKVIDPLAWQFAGMCGFNERPLFIGATAGFGDDFKMLGRPVTCMDDMYVVKKADKAAGTNILIIFEDKFPQRAHAGMDENFMALLLGDMLSLNYHSVFHAKHRQRANIFAMRFVTHHVNFFRLAVTKQQLEDVCIKNKIPAKKLSVLSHVDRPLTCPGLDLTKAKDRYEAAQVIAAIRASVVP